ncbi:redoxin domain-containing protein [Pelomonas sp. SE-A7]|uniref:redoxin domain-containing protein n=1 Tax=Pelomonas sp. SE-A7 TaxID=3054953 RepID=UPI00259D19EF|nr:redoxin domain-containing protein [Pelomonas sp. SE-A7]MDM4765639.1 redoxin domain-containing protein [Pelomonas sp. SE-A7]
MRRRELLLAMPFSGSALAAPAQRGERVAWPVVRLLDGQAWTPLEGHAQVVVFWSLDCAFCERHNAHVEKLHRAAQGRRLQLLGAARGGDAAALRKHMAARGWSFPVSLDVQPLAAALTVRRSVPVTVTVEASGRLRDMIPGEMFEADVMELLRLAP